jgi:hypothetical protein
MQDKYWMYTSKWLGQQNKYEKILAAIRPLAQLSFC